MPERVRPGDLITADFFNTLLDRLEELGRSAEPPDLSVIITRLNGLEERIARLEALLNQFVRIDMLDSRLGAYQTRAEAVAQVGELVRRNEFENRMAEYPLRSELETRFALLVTRNEFNTRFNLLDQRFINVNTNLVRGGGGGLIQEVSFTEISGIGESRAKALQDAGISDIGKLAATRPERVAEVLRVNPEAARQMVEEAARLTKR